MRPEKQRREVCIGLISLSLCCVSLVFFPLQIFSQTSKSIPQATLRTITIITGPMAIIWIDGVRYGQTDESGKMTITSIMPGSHSIRVRKAGFKETSRPLLQTQKGNVEVPLTKTLDEAELVFQQAESIAASDREKAIEAYKKAVKLRPKYLDAYIGLARIYSDSGNFEMALGAVREARNARPGYAEASAIEGRVFNSSGNAAKAVASFKRAISEGKGFQPEAYTGLGLIYKDRAEVAAGNAEYEQESKDYAEAAKYFTTAVKQLSGSPDGLVVYQFLGLVYEQQKKYKEAIAVYEMFLQLFPDSPESTAVRSFIVQLTKQMNEPK